MRDQAAAATQRLTDTMIADYRGQGFLHVPGVLTATEAQEFLTDANAVLDQEEKASWDGDDGNVMEWVADPEVASEAMRRLALHPRVCAIAEQLAGMPLRLFKTELLRKRAGHSASTPAHIDAPAFPFRGAPVTLTAWVALTDVPVERGCLIFLPGSHLMVQTGKLTELGWDPMSALPELAWVPQVAVPIRAGDVTFHHERTVHLAGPNRDGADRVSLTTVYMDAAATFAPADIQLDLTGDLTGIGPDALRRLQPGQPMDHARFPRLPGRARTGPPQ